MSQDMSTFFTGVRRNPPDGVGRTRTSPRPGTGAAGGGQVSAGGGGSPPARRNRKVQGGAGVGRAAGATGVTRAAGAAGATRATGTAGAAGAPRATGTVRAPGAAGAPRAVGAAPRSPRPLTRLTGGGDPPAVYQSTATSNQRRQQLAMPPPRTTPAIHRPREVEWIMKPSKRFVQCSESSSEECCLGQAALKVLEMQQLYVEDEKRVTLQQQLEDLQPMAKRVLEQDPKQVSRLTRARVRASRVFCVPSQRIMHVEELKQAQLRQMQPRKTKSPPQSLKESSPERKSKSPTQSLKESSPERKRKSPSRSPDQSLKEPIPEGKRKPSPQSLKATPSKTFHKAFPSRKASSRSLDDKYLVRVSETVTRLMDIPPPPTGLTWRVASPKATLKPSQTWVQEASQCPEEKEDPSPCASDTPPPDTCTCSCSCPTQKSSPHPSSTSNSSLSTSGTECSCERDIPKEFPCDCPRYRPGPGSKAVKLTSTVIKIMPDRGSGPHVCRKGRKHHHSRCKLRAKSHCFFCRVSSKTSKNPSTQLAQNAPMIQSIAPPKSIPKVKVSKPIVQQSVNHVVNQLTAQLKEATKIKSLVKLGQASLARLKTSDGPAKKQDSARSLTRKTSFYLVMNQAKPGQSKAKAASAASTKVDWVIQPMEKVKEHPSVVQLKDKRASSGGERVNPYLSESQDQVRHNYDIYLKPAAKNDPKNQATQRDPGKSPTPGRQTPSGHSLAKGPRKSGNPYLNSSEWSRVHSQSLMSQPVSLNRIPKPRVIKAVLPPSEKYKQEQQEEALALAAGKIVRKAQHKVPRTMEDGIDMSYQYFVSIPLKRGKKPQVVRYLYRPMVRQLNPQRTQSPSRRASKRAKRRRAAAAAAAAAEAGVDPLSQPELESLDPALAALGGAPLPLGDPPIVEEKKEEEVEPPREPKPEEIPTVKFDPEAALNSPYKVPPLKLKSRYMPLLEKLDQIPYPDERASRKRRSRRQQRTAGGSEKIPPSDYEDQSVLSIGGGDEHILLKDLRAPTGPPVRRAALVNYQAKPTHLGTATGVPITFHQPMFITHKLASEDEPMIQTITYEHVHMEELEKEQLEREQREREEEEREEQEKQQQELDRRERERVERELKLELELQQKAKSVKFQALPVFASRETTSESSTTSSSVSSTSSSVSFVRATGSRSPKAKSKKRKGRARGKGKGRK